MSAKLPRWQVIQFAFTVPVASPAERAVVLSYAVRAGAKETAWPSLDQLADDTGGYYRETLTAARRALVQRNVLVDTGERRGQSGRVAVYRVNVRQKPQILPVDKTAESAALAAHSDPAISGNCRSDVRQKPQIDERQKPHGSYSVNLLNEQVQGRDAPESEQVQRIAGLETAADKVRRSFPTLFKTRDTDEASS